MNINIARPKLGLAPTLSNLPVAYGRIVKAHVAR